MRFPANGKGRPHAAVDLGNGMSRLRPYEAEDYALDSIMDKVDDLFLSGNFAKVDELLEALEPAELGINLTVGWLTATCDGRDKLVKRSAFVDKAFAYFQRVAPPRAANLIKGLT